MTETLGRTARGATEGARDATKDAGDAARPGALTDLAHSPAVDRLKEEARDYLAAQAQRLLVGAGRKLGETTGKLNDIAEGNSPGLVQFARDSGRKLAEGKGPLRSALEMGAGRAKENVLGALKGLGGGKGKRKRGAGNKPTVIIESVDVGVPLRTAYDQWTQYQDFSTFAKGVKSASRADDTHSDWQMKIFWSSRGWKAHTIEQVPDYRITWTSEGAKGTTKGAVTFHELADDLTRVLLTIEYYPQGLFEKTGNIWRAQGRRARLDLKNYARFLTLKGEAEDSWRGEIRDGEVVRSHEDALAEEEQDETPEDDEAAAEDEEYTGDEEEPEPDDEPRDSDEDEGEDEEKGGDGGNAEYDEDTDEEYEEGEEGPEDEYESEGAGEEDSDEEPYEDEDEERAAVSGSRR